MICIGKCIQTNKNTKIIFYFKWEGFAILDNPAGFSDYVFLLIRQHAQRGDRMLLKELLITL
jgi:hypothetical protein